MGDAATDGKDCRDSLDHKECIYELFSKAAQYEKDDAARQVCYADHVEDNH